jgi:hypothetical protein
MIDQREKLHRAENLVSLPYSSEFAATTATHHTSMMYRIGGRKEATNLAWRLPGGRLRSRPSWLVGACLLANLPSKNMLTKTQLILSKRCDQNGGQWLPWCPTPSAGANNSDPECWLIVVCSGAGSEAPWRPWDDGDRHGRWGTVYLALASFYLTKNYFSTQNTSLIGPTGNTRIIIPPTNTW